jgi:carboxylesterase type B
MTEVSGRRGRATKLMNRLSERDALDRLIEEVRDGQSRALVVRGDPGVGKTVLLEYVYTPRVRSSGEGGLPVLVWIHGGRFTLGAGRHYDGTKLAAEALVVVTINHRLGAFGFLAHPALATERGGPSGNYGLMDQQATLRWVQGNIGRFGGDPHNVTIAGQSSGGTSVLANMISRGSRGLFHRAIVQSGSFALTQQSLAAAQADGEAFAAKAGAQTRRPTARAVCRSRTS